MGHCSANRSDTSIHGVFSRSHSRGVVLLGRIVAHLQAHLLVNHHLELGLSLANQRLFALVNRQLTLAPYNLSRLNVDVEGVGSIDLTVGRQIGVNFYSFAPASLSGQTCCVRFVVPNVRNFPTLDSNPIACFRRHDLLLVCL